MFERVVMVVGKTGGHVYPALTIADAMRARMADVDIRFVCPDRPMVQRMIESRGYRTETIRASRVVGGSLREKIDGARNLYLGYKDAIGLLRRLRPDVVIGFGSFLTPPMILAARSLGVFCAIQEQNSIPGLANRSVGKVANLCLLSFEQSREYFPKSRSLVVGNPVRDEIIHARDEATERDEAFTILVLGGSQGARFLNMQMPRVLTRLRDRRPLRVYHQTGPADLPMVEKLYFGDPDHVTIKEYFDDVGAVYAKCDFAVCRSGAGVVFELLTVGVPALFVPFPYAASNHQFHNAMALVQQGGALVMTEDEFDVRRVTAIIEALMDEPEELEHMRRKLRVLANPYASDQIIDALFEARSRKHGGRS